MVPTGPGAADVGPALNPLQNVSVVHLLPGSNRKLEEHLVYDVHGMAAGM